MENQIICANCNYANSTKNLFCQNCGKPLTAARPAAPVIPVEPVRPISEPQIAPPPVVPMPPSFQPSPVSAQTMPPQAPPVAPAVPPMPVAPAPAAWLEASPAAEAPKVAPAPPAWPEASPAVEAPKALPASSVPAQPPMTPNPAVKIARPFSMPQISGGNKIHQLGISTDSWSAVVENGAEKGAEVADEFDRLLNERGIPEVTVTRKELAVDGEVNGRTFHLLQKPKGGTIAVYFGPLGKDLLISWDVYLKPELNLIYLGILLGGAAVLTLIITLISGITNAGFIAFLFTWVSRFYNWLFPVIVAAVLAGLFLKGDGLAFFIKRPSKFSQDDSTGLMILGHQMILKAIEAAGLDVEKFRIKRGLRGGCWFRKI